mgnify:CR=1 FL=1
MGVAFVILSPTMPDDSYRPAVKAKRSSAGLGLFAMENISKEQLIIEYTGERISQDEANKRGGRYLFEVTDELVIDGKGRDNIARYLNHSCAPNAEAEHDEDGDRIYIRACKNIKIGEEITYDYGKNYVEDIIGPEGCRCAKCVKK